ncbi:ABC transporter permease [Janibacter limosus]|uniref:ABC transporter permease n=1 Tax=Janibacter limosus TaxID=53458 RepID=A0A4P6MW02_9MICO|nr:ABC transporter permease [Janibacter limosus]QBF47136.1 ABC transporter permease [Janibacter limosus]
MRFAHTAGRAVLRLLLVIVIVSFATSLLLDLVPGDPAVALLGETATPEQVAALHQELRLDDPLAVRYVAWASHAAQGDLGNSLATGESVTSVVLDRLPVTAELTLLAIMLAALIAIPVAILAAYRPEGVVDRVMNTLTSGFIASPPFLTGVFLIFIFAIKADLVPPTGWAPLSEGLGDNLQRVVLPAITLALTEAAMFYRVLRSDMITVLREDYILNARARGLPTGYILLRHALRPSSFSVLTLFGLSVGRLLSGAVVIEVLFALPGLGQLLVNSVLSRDLLVVQGVVLFMAVAYVLINRLVDVGYGLLDPRVREAAAR